MRNTINTSTMTTTTFPFCHEKSLFDDNDNRKVATNHQLIR